MSFQLSDQQIEFAIEYWLSLLTSDDKFVKAKFEKALRKTINKYRDQLRYISIDNFPHRILTEVLKLADMSIDLFPISKIQMFFHESGTDVWKDGKYVYRNGEKQ